MTLIQNKSLINSMPKIFLKQTNYQNNSVIQMLDLL